MPAGEVLFRQRPVVVEVEELFLAGGKLLQLSGRYRNQVLDIGKRRVCGLGLVPEIIGRDEKLAKLFAVHGLQIVGGDFVAAGVADVFRGARADIHLRPAGAVCKASEQVDRSTLWAFGHPLVRHDGVAAVPELGRHNRLDLVHHPIALRLEGPGLLIVCGAGVVLAVLALGRGVGQETLDGGVREQRAVAGPIAAGVEKFRYGPPAFVFCVELIDQSTDRSLLRIRLQPPVLPAIPEDRLTTRRLAELGPDRHRGRHPRGDLFSLPLAHGRDHREEQAAGGGAGVNALLERDQIRTTGAKHLGDLKQLLRVPSQTSELREHQARNPA
jgi:hypothetical protein